VDDVSVVIKELFEGRNADDRGVADLGGTARATAFADRSVPVIGDDATDIRRAAGRRRTLIVGG
jgi:hypothetical protein